ncbi:MAG: sigma-70 family RNA polymerase sigma factor [Planctomycetaceae bacterium]|nr:sigma-70 family RNA polymerase sigma factor [Planctomycetaceae bacterium]
MTFPTTRWTLIRQAAGQPGAASRVALEELCRFYAGPVFRFISRRVTRREEAEDATQEFFSQLLAGSLLDRADRNAGQFRSFLLHAVRNFLSDRRDYHDAVRRGGRVRHVTLDEADLPAALNHLNADEEFEVHWARTVLQRALNRLQQEYCAADRESLWLALQSQLDQDGIESQLELAGRLQMSHSALRVALHRMKRRLGCLIREEVAETVPHYDDVEEELMRLRAILEKKR